MRKINLRIRILILITVLIFGLFTYKLIDLQIINGNYYMQKSQDMLLKNSDKKAPRGNILDRNGKVIVTNKENFNILIKNSDKKSETLDKSIEILKKILIENNDEDKVKEIENKIKEETYSKYDETIIAENISKESAMKFKERKEQMPEFKLSNDWTRNYIYNDLLCHTVGYVGKITKEEYELLKNNGYSYNEIIGKDGIEKMFESYLKGTDGKKQLKLKYKIPLEVIEDDIEYQKGDNIYLTIDLDLQIALEEAIKNNLEKIGSNKAGAVIKDIDTGEILAIASFPTYNPNEFIDGISNEKWIEYNDNETKPLFNRAISGLYSVGSTFKMITAIAGLEEGIITKNTKILDEGVYTKIDGISPRCLIYSAKNNYRTHGKINVIEAIGVSCNYFFYQIGHQLGIDNISKYAKYFELGNKTGIELIGESDGIVASKEYRKSLGKEWYLGEVLSASIGQSDNSFTPIQMANYISIIGNYGLKTKTHIIQKIQKFNNEEVDSESIKKTVEKINGKYEANSLNTIKISKTNYDIILEAMKYVVKNPSGTAYSTFKDSNLDIKGKTGTVEVGGYNKDGTLRKDDGWFVGLIKGKKYNVSVAVVVEQAGHGTSVAPIVKDILDYL